MKQLLVVTAFLCLSVSSWCSQITTITNPANASCTVGLSADLRYTGIIPNTVWRCGGSLGPGNGSYQILASKRTYAAQANGLYCDGQTLTDVTTLTGSPLISSASYRFSQSDVGKLISVNAGTGSGTVSATYSAAGTVLVVASTSSLPAGLPFYAASLIGPGIPNGTTLNKIQSATQIKASGQFLSSQTSASVNYALPMAAMILSVANGVATMSSNAAASETLTMATFGTGDGAAFNTLVGTVSGNGGGLIKLPSATCVVDQSVGWASGVSMQGEGSGKSILKWISLSDQVNPVINGNAATYLSPFSDNQMSYFEIDQSSATATAGYQVQAKGISFPNSIRSSVDHVYILNAPATCVATDESIATSITDNFLVDCGRDGASNSGSNGIGEGTINGNLFESYIITGNYVENATNAAILMEAQSPFTPNPAAYVLVENNTVVGGTQSGYGSTATGILLSGVYGEQVIGNKCIGLYGATGWQGIFVGPGTYTGPLPSVETMIKDNSITGAVTGIGVSFATSPGHQGRIIIDGNKSYSNTGAGIEVVANASTAFQVLKISNNSVYQNGRAGIFLVGAGGMQNVSLVNNSLYDNGTVTASTQEKSGIEIDTNIAGLTVTGNDAFDNLSGYQHYGLSIASGFAASGALVTGNNFTGNATGALYFLGTLTGVMQTNYGFPAFSVSGCGATSPTGSGDTGTFTTGTASACTAVITPFGTANYLVPTGWACQATDLTHTADGFPQSASSTSSASLTGTPSSGDLVSVSCRPY